MPVTKAPAGGMIVNNSFARGGQFLAKPLARVSLVMKRLRAMKLARADGERAFVSAVERMADDRTTRGAFADFLEERGRHHDDGTLDILRHHEGPVSVAVHPRSRKVVAWRGQPVRDVPSLDFMRQGSGEPSTVSIQPFGFPLTTPVEVVHGPNGIVAIHRADDGSGFALTGHHPRTGRWLGNRVVTMVGKGDKRRPLTRLADARAVARTHAFSDKPAQQRYRLARAPKPFVPGTFTQKELLAPAGGEPHGATFSLAQLQAIEDHHDIPKKYRLSLKAKMTANGGIQTKKDDALAFLHAARKSAARSIPGLRAKSDDDAGAIAVHHLASEAGHAMFYPHGQDAKTWYGTHVGELEKTIGRHFGWDRTDPRHTLFKTLVALTSSGQNPKMNALTAFKILHEAKGDFLHLPKGQEKRYAQFHRRFEELHGKPPEGLPDPLEHPHAAAAFYYQHLHAHPELHNQFYGVPASVFRHKDVPNHPLNGKVAALDRSGTWKPTPEGPQLWQAAGGDKRHFEKVILPRPDEQGRPKPKSWTQRGEGLGEGVETLSRIVRHFNGDHEKAAKWLLTDHTPEEFAAVTGSGPNAGYLADEERFPGTFAFGPKFGPFALNLHTGTMPELGKYLTPDLWWSRTWNRFLGTLMNSPGNFQEDPRTDTERKKMYEAAKKAAAATITPQGDTLTVAELQAVLWYHEQRMMRHLGVKADSFSYSDGARAIEKFLRGGK